MTSNRWRRGHIGIPGWITILLSWSALTACGGGGGGGGNGGVDGDDPASGEVATIVFMAVQSGDAFFSLWSAADDGSTLDRIDDAAVVTSGPTSFAVAPDRSSIAYLQKSPGGLPGLHVTDMTGTGRTEITGNAESSAVISGYAWSPDGEHVAFVSDQATAGTGSPEPAVYVVDVDGGNLREIGQGITDTVDNPRWSPDGRYVAMEISTAAGGDYQIAVYDIQTDTLVPAINGNAASNIGEKEFVAIAWSPDNTRIAYLTDRDTDNKFELYISTIDGITTVKPHAAIEGSVGSFAWRPGDGGRIGYVAELETSGTGLISELFTAAADGSDVRKEHVNLTFGTLDVQGFAWSPDGQHIAYSRDQTLIGVTDLFVNTKAGDQPVAQFEFTSNDLTSFHWSLDSERLVYRTRGESGFTARLWSISRTGFNNHRSSAATTPSPLNGPDSNAGPIFLYMLSPALPLIAYSVDLGDDDLEELYLNTSDGGSEERLNPEFEPGQISEVISWFEWSPTAATLAYLVAKNSGPRALYAGGPGGGDPVKLSGDLNVAPVSTAEPSY